MSFPELDFNMPSHNGLVLPTLKDSTFGVTAEPNIILLMGLLLSYGLFGILFVQMFVYYTSFPRDSRRTKCFVYLVFFLECLSTVLITRIVVVNLSHTGNLVGDSENKTILLEFVAFLCGVVTLLIHAFYSWRIWIIGKSYAIPILVLTLSIVQCVMVTYSGIAFNLALDTPPTESQVTSEKQYMTTWLGGSVLCDIIIASRMAYMLHHANAVSVNQESKTILSKITALIIETGAITALGAVTELVLCYIFPDTLNHLVLFFMVPKLYANCMMASLNARALFIRIYRAQGAFNESKQATELRFHDHRPPADNENTLAPDGTLQFTCPDGQGAEATSYHLELPIQRPPFTLTSSRSSTYSGR